MTALRTAMSPEPAPTSQPVPEPVPRPSPKGRSRDLRARTARTEERRPFDAPQLRALLEAQRVINSDLSLADMLTRLVSTACALAGARRGALGVLGSGGAFEQLVHQGVDPQRVASLAAAAPGTGELLADLVAEDPQGCDAGRARLTIQVPLRGDRETSGEIVLAGPVRGRFTDVDADLVTALAATACAAIANARLYEDSRRSRDWLRASGEITRALLADADVDMLLEVVSRALHVAEADFTALILPNIDGTELTVAVCVGAGSERFVGTSFAPDHSEFSRIMAAGESALLPDLTQIVRDEFDNREGFGPIMIAPLVAAKGGRGAVVLLRHRDHPVLHRP